MSERIEAGDLVMVVRGHECVLRKRGGIPHVVRAIVPQTGGGWHCDICGQFDLAKEAVWAANLDCHKHPGSGIPLGWLKKIPPLSELEDKRTEERLHEPA